MKCFDFHGVTFMVTEEHFGGYIALAHFVDYEEQACGGITYAEECRRDDCYWEI